MEGELWKWTNYWNGWQSRWFILEDGILSYYKSYEEVSQGCKGSMNVSVCEIVVSHADNTRLDLVISGGEQYMYLRANSETERQQWLIALGSAKACLSNRPRRQRGASSSSVSSDAGNGAEEAPSLKTRKSELRLYSDLLMQQVHTIKSAVRPDGTIDVARLEEGASLLPQTCDTFTRTLDAVMKVADAGFVYPSSSARVGDPAAELAMMSHHANGIARKTSRGSITNERSGTPVGSAARRRRPSDDLPGSRLSPSLSQLDESPTSSPENGSKVAKNREQGFQSVFGNNAFHYFESLKVSGSSPDNTPSKSNRSTPNRDSISPEVDPIARGTHLHDNPIQTLGPKFPLPTANGVASKEFLVAASGALVIYEFLGSSFSRLHYESSNMVFALCCQVRENPNHWEYVATFLNNEQLQGPDNSHPADILKKIVSHLKFLHNFLRCFIESNPDTEISKCLTEAVEQNPHQPVGELANNILEAARDLEMSRSDFVRHFGFSHKMSAQNLQTRLFPIVADYLESMELCLRNIDELIDQRQRV